VSLGVPPLSALISLPIAAVASGTEMSLGAGIGVAVGVAVGALVVGVSLGLLGSGGAILTVPILVYLVGHDEKAAIVESLAIVGLIAGVSASRAAFGKRIDWPSVLLLAAPGAVGAAGGSALAHLVSGGVQLLALAALMLMAALLMLRSAGDPADAPRATETRSASQRLLLGAVQGVLLGLITGFVGIGGGFLLIPVLTLLRGLPMSIAVGTSLAIITINATIGFAASLGWGLGATGDPPPIDVGVMAAFAAVGLAGSLAGDWFRGRLSQPTLRRAFGCLLLLVGGFVVVQRGWALWASG
jgi:uncharacterized protein